jgi:hypothetical protein
MATELMTNIYSLKKGMLSQFIKTELRSPTIRMAPI